MNVKTKRRESEMTAKAMTFVRISSKEDHESAKAAGQPVMEVVAGNRSADGFHDFGGMSYLDGEGSPVIGKLPGSWTDFIASKKVRAGRPRKAVEIKVGMLLAVQNFIAQGYGTKESRILAAQRMVPGTDAEAAEKKYRRDEKSLLNSRALKDFNRFLVAHDKEVMMAHKTAVVDVQKNGLHLAGRFWFHAMGDASAQLVDMDVFIPLKTTS